MKLRNIDSRKTVKAFERMGMKILHQAGTHIIMKGILNGKQKTLSIPIHHKEISVGVLTDLLNNQAEISREEFFKYY